MKLWALLRVSYSRPADVRVLEFARVGLPGVLFALRGLGVQPRGFQCLPFQLARRTWPDVPPLMYMA